MIRTLSRLNLRTINLPRTSLRLMCNATSKVTESDACLKPSVTTAFDKQIIDVKTREELAQKFITESTKEDVDLHWDSAMSVIHKSEEIFPPSRPTPDDLLQVRAAFPTTSLASLVNSSSTLQRLVDLGVGLHHWESRGHLDFAVKLDFVRDVAPIVRFLADIGVPHDLLGHVLTVNPLLIEEEIGVLKTRVAYLASKKFTAKQIAGIVGECPAWLSFPVKSIDQRLGFFQKGFKLSGNEVRDLAVSLPKLITWAGTPGQVRTNVLAVNQWMGFSNPEAKQMLMKYPRIFRQRDEDKMLEQFNFLHTEVGFPHEILVKFPRSLTLKVALCRPRHEFLMSIGRAQYDPKLPNYVSPEALTDGEDLEFCQKVAKCSYRLYNQFLKMQ